MSRSTTTCSGSNPAGEQVQPAGHRPRAQHITPREAQDRAPFTVLIPDRIPSDWRVHCALTEQSHRPPRPASVALNYRSDDGNEGLSLSQYAAENKPEQYDLMIATDGWRMVTHDGCDVEAYSRRAIPSAHTTPLHLRVPLIRTLSGARLAAIAAGLKPVPGETGG
jgi:hypothetical protein